MLWPKRGRLLSLKRALSMPFLKMSNASWMHMYLRDVLGVENELLVGGVNREVFHPTEVARPSRPFRVLCSGDPRERKGVDTIREALDLVRGDAPDVELATYYGKGIPQNAMADTYCSADLFVDAQWYAGWNNPVAEAMACGVPVVCSDIGGVADFAFHEETALLFPVGRADRLARAIQRMMQDEALRHRLKINALNQIVRFDWNRSAARLHRLLEDRVV
jgi:glycosyltransferase involved in cell wall biosynthesis